MRLISWIHPLVANSYKATFLLILKEEPTDVGVKNCLNVSFIKSYMKNKLILKDIQFKKLKTILFNMAALWSR